MRGVRQHGHGSVRGEGGERKKRPAAASGEGGRHSRTRAGDDGKGGRNGPLPEGGPHKGPRDRSGVGPVRAREAKPAGITLHHSPEQSHHTCSAEPTRNTTAPREPEEATPTRERDRCRHTDAYTDGDPRAAVGPHVRRRAGRGQQPFSHRTVPSPRARSINARHGPSRPRGGEGGLPRFRQPWERCRGKGGRGDTTTQPEKHTARTTRGAGPRRGSGQSRGREREGRTRRKARVRHGKTGGDPGAHRRLPTPRPARRPSGGEESTAHAGVCTEPSPQPPPHNRSHMAPQQRQDDRQALPRVIPPRTRSGEARAAVDERANAARAGGGQGASPPGDHSGETPRDRKKPAPFPEDS